VTYPVVKYPVVKYPVVKYPSISNWETVIGHAR
jgi:hypothetical protein